MAVVRVLPTGRKISYPTGDGKPMAETDWHRVLMVALIETLQIFFAGKPNVSVSGNLLVFYEPGNRRRHVAPGVFVVRGVPNRRRENYLVWEEGKPPEVVVELTSSWTRREDVSKTFTLYQDKLQVKEYFLFDPFLDYLNPPLQGHRLRKGQYVPIRPVGGRLPSQVLGLHLERRGDELRLYDPATGLILPTPHEARLMAEEQRRIAEQQRHVAETEAERLRRENEELRRRLAERGNHA